MSITTDRKTSNAQPPAKSLPVVDLFTDGSCRGKKQRIGGWAFILRHRSTGVEKVQSGGLHKSSGEQAEIHAVINGLSALRLRSHVLLHCDNIGVVNGVSQFLPEWKRFGWRLSPKAKQLINNVDLWQMLDALLAKHDVTVKWVKGHAGHPDNERCDKLSGKAADELLKNGGILPASIQKRTISGTPAAPAPAVKSVAAQTISTPVKPDEKLHEVDLFTDGAC
ncbi:MAG TPA: ribonuclease H, partial [Humisphaera sp.]|nr:ribonuclease H [Humisphaera sp.]